KVAFCSRRSSRRTSKCSTWRTPASSISAMLVAPPSKEAKRTPKHPPIAVSAIRTHFESQSEYYPKRTCSLSQSVALARHRTKVHLIARYSLCVNVYIRMLSLPFSLPFPLPYICFNLLLSQSQSSPPNHTYTSLFARECPFCL